MRRVLLFAGTCCILVASAAWCRAQELTAENFRELHAELQPEKDAAWRTIPWKISLLDAQRTAAGQHKPIFIWAMDGHPLGCT